MHYWTIVEQIKNRRESLLVTQEMLADIAGVSLRALKQLESGKGNPTLQTIHKIAEALGLELTLNVKTIA
jgi:transcriptional regulator with XRE-family HTH domain